jgi:myotubularin-related protein 9
MEFAELIKTPKLDRITLLGPLNQSMEGTLCITSHHLIVSSRSDTTQELWVLLISKFNFYSIITQF